MSFAVKVAEDLGSNILELEMSPKTELDQAELKVVGIDKHQKLTIDGGMNDTI